MQFAVFRWGMAQICADQEKIQLGRWSRARKGLAQRMAKRVAKRMVKHMAKHMAKHIANVHRSQIGKTGCYLAGSSERSFVCRRFGLQKVRWHANRRCRAACADPKLT